MKRGARGPAPQQKTPPKKLSSVVEHIRDLGVETRDDDVIEEGVKSCEDNRADYHADDDFYTGVDVTFCLCIIKSALCLDCNGVCLVLNVFEKLFNKSLPHIFLCFFIWRAC